MMQIQTKTMLRMKMQECNYNGQEVDQMDERYGKRSGRYDLRARKPRSYEHSFHHHEYNDQNNIHTEIKKSDQLAPDIGTGERENDTVLETPQMSMKQGLKMFGEAGVNAVKKEMQ